MEDPVRYLRNLKTVRAHSAKIFDYISEGKSSNFAVDFSKFDEVVDYVEKVAHANFKSTADIPFHSRWRHFEVGGIDRISTLLPAWGNLDKVEICRRKIDLAIVSVLLDAGAGPQWKFL